MPDVSHRVHTVAFPDDGIRRMISTLIGNERKPGEAEAQRMDRAVTIEE